MVSEALRNVRLIREKLNFSQEQMAEMMQISQSQYARFERGATKTDLETLADFAKEVKMSLLDVLTYPDKFVRSTDQRGPERFEATLLLTLPSEKRDQVLDLVFGSTIVDLLKE